MEGETYYVAALSSLYLDFWAYKFEGLLFEGIEDGA
jgi:hypothetical protein